MTIFTLLTKLNFKIVSIVLLLIITVTTYNHWLFLQEENNKNTQRMMAFTNYMINKKPANVFSENALQQTGITASNQDQVLRLNQELQPILNDIFLPINTLKFGFYSRHYESIVAIGPQFDISMLKGVDPTEFNIMDNTEKEQLVEKDHSLLWHGAAARTYVRPIKEHDVIVGYAFASYDQNSVYSLIWQRTITTFLGAFVMLLVCITIFRKLFSKLKQNLESFAQSIVDGPPYNHHCEIAEFSPIFKHINEQTEKITRLDRLNIIGEMAAGIAHEIRNPMTTVRGLLQFMGNKGEFIDQKDNFILMINELDRANSIITEFLSLAKNSVMNFRENNLNTILHEIYPLLQADALSNNCEIKLALTDIPNLSMAPNSIRQLIFNMIRNALDARPRNGMIHISTRTISAKVLLTIEDSGIGMSAEVINKLGTPFFTTKDQGTGLGLAICYRIAQRHAATVIVESHPQKGTTFTIAFPLSSQLSI